MKDYEGSRIWKPSDFLEMSVQRASDSSVLFDAVADFVTTKRLEQKSARTVGNYQYDLKTFLQVVGAQTPMANISPQMVKQYLLLSQQRPGPYSHFSRYRSLRVFFNWCVREGYLPSNPLTVRPPKLPQRVMPIFSDADLRAMVDACTESTALRDRALLLVLMDTGMRLNEVVFMRAEHISWEEGALHVYGKGNKERIVVPSRPTLLAIYRYLKARRSPLENIWLSEERRPLTRSGVQQIIKRISMKALGKAAGPHKFRHTFACNYLANGGSIDSLQYILGHSSLKMVMQYVEATKAQRARAQSRLFSPVERLGLKA
jgi:integrase/recombinase XerC